MNIIKKGWQVVSDFLGFRRNDKYVSKYLNDANIRSSIYMSFIVISIEIWMIFRQFNKYIIPGWDKYASAGGNLTLGYRLETIFNNTSFYLLFIMCSLALFVYAITYINKSFKKPIFILNLVLGGLCISWIFLLIPQQVDYAKVTDAICIIALY